MKKFIISSLVLIGLSSSVFAKDYFLSIVGDKSPNKGTNHTILVEDRGIEQQRVNGARLFIQHPVVYKMHRVSKLAQ